MSPTARALAECKRRGWVAQVVEHYNWYTKRKHDLFGCIDILVLAQLSEPCAFCMGGARPDLVDGPWESCNLCDDIGEVSTRRILGIQVTSGANHAARRAKIAQEPRIKAWLEAGGRMAIWSYSKAGARGKAKRWTLREESVSL